MLRKFCERVNIVLDTSQIFGIISHTEQQLIEKVPNNQGRGFYIFFYSARLYLTRKTHRLVSSGSVLNDDSQFFATALYLPEPAGKFAPPILID
jgi:hypothetical protein